MLSSNIRNHLQASKLLQSWLCCYFWGFVAIGWLLYLILKEASYFGTLSQTESNSSSWKSSHCGIQAQLYLFMLLAKPLKSYHDSALAAGSAGLHAAG